MGRDELLKLADRVESGKNQWGDWCLAELCRELEQVDTRPNVNGSCAGYLYDLDDAKRLIPRDHCYSICSDKSEVRAVVAFDLTEREKGFSAVPFGHGAELRALVAAALRALAQKGE